MDQNTIMGKMLGVGGIQAKLLAAIKCKQSYYPPILHVDGNLLPKYNVQCKYLNA